MPGGDTAETGGRLLVIGADHRTAPPAWRDQFAIIEANLGAELDRLRAMGFGDLTLLATCERIELLTAEHLVLSLVFLAHEVPLACLGRLRDVARLLRVCDERGSEQAASEGPNKCPPIHYWITSSARSSSGCGILSPSALAVLRLTTR